MHTLYDLIGARPEDDAESLKKAYRQAVKATHPDHHGDDPEAVTRFTEIRAAYDVLRDGGQRAAYDRTLEARREPLPAAAKGAAAPRTHTLVYTMTFSVALALTLSGGLLLLARVSGIEAAVGRKAHANETATVRPARLATTPEMPMVAPIAITAASDRAASGEIKDRTASEATRDAAASAQTRDGVASAQTGEGIASPETREAAAPERTRDPTVSAETGERTAVLETGSAAASEQTRETTASQLTAPAPASPAADVARDDADPESRVMRIPAPEKHNAVPVAGSAPSARHAARSDPRTSARVRDPANTDAGDGRLQAVRRPAGSSAVEHAVLGTGSVPPLFGIGF